MSLLLALFAQPMVSKLPDNAQLVPPKQVRALVAAYGDCIVKREAARASAAIIAGLGSNDMLARYPQLLQESCVPGQLGDLVQVKFTEDQYRYAIADALVRRELAAVPPPVLDEVAPLAHGGPTALPTVDRDGRPLAGRALEAATRSYDKQRAANYLWRYGECVVRVDPASAKTLLMTAPGSKEENVSFSAIGTALGTCLAQGKSLEFGKADLRGTIAVNYYRLAMAARPVREASR